MEKRMNDAYQATSWMRCFSVASHRCFVFLASSGTGPIRLLHLSISVLAYTTWASQLPHPTSIFYRLLHNSFVFPVDLHIEDGAVEREESTLHQTAVEPSVQGSFFSPGPVQPP